MECEWSVPLAPVTSIQESSLATTSRIVSFFMASCIISATSCAVECISPAHSSKSRPCGFLKSVPVQPSFLARSFMAFTNVASASLVLGSIFLPTYSASTMAASLPEGIIRPRSACSTVSSSPSSKPAVELPTVAAALLTVTFSSILQFSTVRIAVMTLVIEAILTCSSASRA